MAWIHPAEPVPEQPKGRMWNYVPPLVEKLVPPVMRLWGKTLREIHPGWEHLERARREGGGILTAWHGNLVMTIHTHRDAHNVGLVSPVWEGELIARVVTGMGYDLVRGSSNYQASASLRGTLRALREGKVIATILDGPQGPRRVIKPGAIYLAALSGRPILPTYTAAEFRLMFPSWDLHEVALPFSRIACAVGEPMYVPREYTKKDTRSLTLELLQRMLKLQNDAFDALRMVHSSR